MKVRFDWAVFGPQIDFRDAKVGGASFRGATFRNGAWFRSSHFGERTWFIEAQFDGTSSFLGATFDESVWFDDVRFRGDASFRDAHFVRQASFRRARFAGSASFYRSKFGGLALFGPSVFTGKASYREATFSTGASFRGARFKDEASFRAAQFAADTSFREAQFEGSALFRGIEFGSRLWLAPSDLKGLLDLSGSSVGGQIRLAIPEGYAELESAQLAGGGFLSGKGTLSLRGVDFRASTVVGRDSSDLAVESLEGANTEALTLHDVGLTRCRFAGTSNLSKMRVEGTCRFARSRGFHARRDVIVEETEPGPGARADRPAPNSAELAAIYRGLRKAREDSGDFPGGSDFYYGEMRMRTLAARERGGTGWIEWGLLSAYRLLGGYGVRAWRPFFWLALLVILGGLMLNWWGFTMDVTDGTAIREALLATVTFLRPLDSSDLSPTGEWITTALRVLGPAFLAVAVFALRARVRR